MAHGKAAANDPRYGRRGGGWVPAGKEPLALDRLCSVCGEPMVGGQTGHHTSCTPITEPDEPPASLFDA